MRSTSKTLLGAQTFEEKSQVSKAVQPSPPTKKSRSVTPTSDVAKEKSENGWYGLVKLPGIMNVLI